MSGGALRRLALACAAAVFAVAQVAASAPARRAGTSRGGPTAAKRPPAKGAAPAKAAAPAKGAAAGAAASGGDAAPGGDAAQDGAPSEPAADVGRPAANDGAHDLVQAAARRGEVVALLSLDAERSLEFYGLPIASELARVLRGGDVPVVVVGTDMRVPERARLVIDGSIVQGKSSAVTISLRLRSTVDGVTLETVSATAPGLAKLDSAAAELSARMLPLVRARVAALAREAPVEARPPSAPPTPAAAAAPAVMLVAISGRDAGGAALQGALPGAIAAWAGAQGLESRAVDPSKLEPAIAGSAITAAGAELALGFLVLAYEPERGAPPMARARVRIQIASTSGIVFDRVVVTDTVLGDRASSEQELATRVAREVLAILRPHLRRHVPSWR